MFAAAKNQQTTTITVHDPSNVSQPGKKQALTSPRKDLTSNLGIFDPSGEPEASWLVDISPKQNPSQTS